jgi:hypothetical protein
MSAFYLRSAFRFVSETAQRRVDDKIHRACHLVVSNRKSQSRSRDTSSLAVDVSCCAPGARTYGRWFRSNLGGPSTLRLMASFETRKGVDSVDGCLSKALIRHSVIEIPRRARACRGGQQSFEIKSTVLSVLQMTLNNPRRLIAKPRFAEMRVCAISSYFYGHRSSLACIEW